MALARCSRRWTPFHEPICRGLVDIYLDVAQGPALMSHGQSMPKCVKTPRRLIKDDNLAPGFRMTSIGCSRPIWAMECFEISPILGQSVTFRAY